MHSPNVLAKLQAPHAPHTLALHQCAVPFVAEPEQGSGKRESLAPQQLSRTSKFRSPSPPTNPAVRSVHKTRFGRPDQLGFPAVIVVDQRQVVLQRNPLPKVWQGTHAT